MNASTVPVRWSLDDLLAAPADDQVNALMLELETMLSHLESARERLSPDTPTSDFLEILDSYEAIARLQRRLAGYSFLWFAEDTQNQAALNLQNRVNQLMASAENRVLFFDLWFKSLEDGPAGSLIEASGDRRYFLESLRRLKPFTLSEPEERVITLKDVNGIEALITVYDLITSAFSFTLEVDGEQKTLTEGELLAYCRHPSAELREAAYRELYRVYTGQTTVLSEIYNNRVLDWHTEMVDLRHFATPMSARNLLNDIPDSVVDTLLSVCRDNAGLFQRYFKLKARWVGMDRLRRYDIYAPLASSEKEYDFQQAVQLVLNAYTAFSPVLAEHARRVLDKNHLDAETRPGKRGGAFCYSALPELTPWVLTNFAGRARDVSTLAHELGHAVHASLASEHSALTYDAATPLAETASVFGEMFLADWLLKDESDPSARRELLAKMVDDAFVTVERQAYFALFERDAHDMIAQGKTVDELTQHYIANLAEQFGNAVDVSDEFRWEWTLIPHIYSTPFYVYSYSFGQLLVLALYQRYQSEGESFKPKYLRLLSYGGSASPSDILAEAGIDITSRAFWRGGFDVIAARIGELEALEARG